MIDTIDSRRIRTLHPGDLGKGPVVYWMYRDQRVDDNWALLYAQALALELGQPLIVIFAIDAKLKGISRRQLPFMLQGLKSAEQNLAGLNIPFEMAIGSVPKALARALSIHKASALVTDFMPLEEKQADNERIGRKIKVPFYEVDTHNIVPCWVASDKQEYAAYTIRPKISRLLSQFLTDIPQVRSHPYQLSRTAAPVNWNSVAADLGLHQRPSSGAMLVPGEREANKTLTHFLNVKLPHYSTRKNDPSENALSDLSPYLHFGHLSPQRAALETQRYDTNIPAQETFLEELIVRRELSDNFCFYNNRYDSVEGFPEWGRSTLEKHQNDIRPYVYPIRKLEQARTHDPLWNAAQIEMVNSGKMHGYMRMYWAKKILEWTRSPVEALSYALHLNDKYELDGHDPNGYVGAAWCIGGVHDRAWNERDIFGKIRYMSFDGCRRKFNIDAYINKVTGRN